MQFIVLAYDGNDEGAPARRLAVRSRHLDQAQKRVQRGEWLYACAILSEEGQMIGSMIVCNYPSRTELDRWLEEEPYMTGKVWQKVAIQRAQVPPFVAKK